MIPSPNRPSILSGSERKEYKDATRASSVEEITEKPYSPVPVYSYIGKAEADIDTNGSGPFTLLDNTPAIHEDSEKSVTAHALRDFELGDKALLVWIIGVDNGGYWLAVGAGSGEPADPGGGDLCFKPCDLFALLDTLSLDDEAQALLDSMKESCECEAPTGSGPCESCPEVPESGVVMQLSGAVPNLVQLPTLEAQPFQPIKGVRVALEADVTPTAMQAIVDQLIFPMTYAGNCLWTGTASVTSNLRVYSVLGFTEDGVPIDEADEFYPNERQFTFNFSAALFITTDGWIGTVSTTSIYDARNGSDDKTDNWEVLGGGKFLSATTSANGVDNLIACGTKDGPVDPDPFPQNSAGFDFSAADFELAYASAVVLPPPPIPLLDYRNKTYFYNPGMPVDSVDFPLPEDPNDNDFVKVVFGGTIDYGETVANNLSFSGGTVFGEFPAAVASGSTITLQYSADFSRWYVV
jgi:hypothetical protein